METIRCAIMFVGGGILTNRHGHRYPQDHGRGPADSWPRPKAMKVGPRDSLSQAFWHEERRGNTVATAQGSLVCAVLLLAAF